MQAVLIALELVVSVALVIVVLLQRSEGGALGMGGGGAGLGLFSPRGAADTLTRTTAVLAVLFFATSLALTILSLRTRPHSILDSGGGGRVQTIHLQNPAQRPPNPQKPSVPIPHG